MALKERAATTEALDRGQVLSSIYQIIIFASFSVGTGGSGR